MRDTVAGSLLVLVTLAAGRASAGPADGDDAAIRKASIEFVAAWNRHDAKAMAAFFAEDGDLVSPWGRVARGRAEVESLFAEEHSGSGALRDSTLDLVEQEVRRISADVAVCDWQTTLSSLIATDGNRAPRLAARVLVVVKNARGAWLCAAARPLALSPAGTSKEAGDADPRKGSVSRILALLRLFQASDVGLAKPWPRLSGKRFVLWVVATNQVDKRLARNLEILFSPGDATRSVEKAGGPAAYERVTLEALRSEEGDFSALTSYVGRRNQEKAHALTAAELEKGAAVIADLSFPDGAVVGFSGGDVRWMTRAELGVPDGEPIVAGDRSASELLKHFSDK